MLTTLLAMLAMTAGDSPSDWSAFPGDGAFAAHSEHTHDPMIFQYKGVTVCFSTSGNGMGVVKTTTDYKTWKVFGPLLKENPDWLKKRIPEHKSVWAPDAIVIGDKVRCYFSASRFFGGNDSTIGFLENDHFDPTHPDTGWVDKGEVIDSNKDRNFYNCIDPEVHIDLSGRHWLYFGSYFAGLYVVQLDPASGKMLDPVGKQPVIVARNTGSRENALEGSAVIHRDGYYYLFVSYGLAAQGVRSTYQIMVGRSKDPVGPFVDAAGKLMVEGGHVNFLKTSPPMFSPGHCEVMKDDKGRWLMSYHYYDGRKYWTDGKWGLPRVQIREMLWNAAGWPEPGLPMEYLAVHKLPTHKSVVGKWVHQADFGNVDELILGADGKFVSGEQHGEWKLNGEELSLKWPKRGAPGEFWEDHVTLKYSDNYYVGRNQTGLIIRGMRVGE